MSFKWLKSGETGYYSRSMAIGVMESEGGVILIDSGLEGGHANRALSFLRKGVEVTSVINTHAHSDHTGNNSSLQDMFGSRVYASRGEAPFVENPGLISSMMFSSSPPGFLSDRFFAAKPSRGVTAIDVGCEWNEVEIDGRRLSFLDIKGHSPGLMAIRDENGIAFLGDIIFSDHMIKNHKLLHVYSVGDYLASLSRVEKLECEKYVISHGGDQDDISGLVEMTRTSISNVSETVYGIASSGPVTEGEIHRALAERLRLVETRSSYFLNHAAVRAHVAYLLENERLEVEIGRGGFKLRAV